jgi:hypothetical protein
MGRSVALIVAALLASACTPLTRGGREAALREHALSLEPLAARVVAEDFGDCVTLALSPSCLDVYVFSGAVSVRERMRRTASAATSEGWSVMLSDLRAGGSAQVFRRGDYEATVTHWAAARTRRCLRELRTSCADVIRISRY